MKMMKTIKNIWCDIKTETEEVMNPCQDDGNSERSQRNLRNNDRNPLKDNVTWIWVIMMEMIFNILCGNSVRHENDETKKPHQEDGDSGDNQGSNISTNEGTVTNPRLEVGTSGEDQENLIINEEIKEIPVTSGGPAPIDQWNTNEEEDPADEQISSKNIIGSKRRSETHVQREIEEEPMDWANIQQDRQFGEEEMKEMIEWINMQQNRAPVTPTAPTLVISKDQWGGNSRVGGMPSGWKNK